MAGQDHGVYTPRIFIRMRTHIMEVGSYLISGVAAGMNKGVYLGAQASNYAVTGVAGTLAKTWALAAGAGTYTITGTAAALAKTLPLAAGAGSYAVTGTAAALRRAIALAASSGSYAVSGTAAVLAKGWRMTAEAGSYAVTGAAAALQINLPLAAGIGSYLVSGAAAALRKTWALAAGVGSYTASGTDANLNKGQSLPGDLGTYIVTGADAAILRGLLASAAAGAYTVAGQTTALERGRSLAAAAGSYAVTGQDVSLTIEGLLAETEALIAAMTVEPTTARKNIIDTLIGDLKSAGVWSKLDVLWVLAAHDSQAARLNWKSPGNFTLGVAGSPTFNTDQGYIPTANGQYLTTGWDPSTDGVNFTQNSASLIMRSNTNQQTNAGSTFGNGLGSDDTDLDPRTAVPGVYASVNCSNADRGNDPATSVGLWVLSRGSSSTFDIYQDNSLYASVSASSAAPSATDFEILQVPSAGHYSARREVSVAALGGALNSSERTALYNAIEAYRASVGF